MSALPSTFPSIKHPSRLPKADPRNTENSVVQLRPMPLRQPAPRSASLFALPNEPEDARITGGTRSLNRRLLALNLSGSRTPAVEH
jgi:hypothetical protein